MSGASYPIGTIRDMAAIPLPERERFLAELPAILDSIAAMEQAMPELAKEARQTAPIPYRWLTTDKALADSMVRQISSRIQWVDDDKKTGTLTLGLNGGEPFWTRSAPLDAPGGSS